MTLTTGASHDGHVYAHVFGLRTTSHATIAMRYRDVAVTRSYKAQDCYMGQATVKLDQ